jgi:metal-responsive CopG/Arc/MetJ family transcriptional regulator
MVSIVTVAMPVEMGQKLEELRAEYGHASRSAIVRMAVESFIRGGGVGGEKSKCPALTWHAVSDQLPDDSEVKLVTVLDSHGGRCVATSYYIKGSWYSDGPYSSLPVIAWTDWPEAWDGEVKKNG